MTDAIDAHSATLTHAFADVLQAEDDIRAAKVELDETTGRLKRQIAIGEIALAEAWRVIAELMKETGELEVELPGANTNYLIRWGTSRESVKAEPDALPDEFVKVERKPKLKEIGDHLRKLRDRGSPFPNWARFESSTPQLTWKAVKK